MQNVGSKWKTIFIFLGIIYLLLSLILISAYTANEINYVSKRSSELSGDKIEISSMDYKTFKDFNNEHGRGLFVVISSVAKDNIGNVGGNIATSFSHFDIYLEILKPFSIIYLIFVAFVLYQNRNQGEYKDIEHGSADWAKDSEIYSVLSRKDGFILAKDIYLPVVPTPPPAKNGNILVIGGSGSGKSASYAIPNAMQMIGSYIFTDPKGELYDKTAGLFKKNGYNIHVINLSDPKYSDGYNPLSHIRNTMDVDIIAKIISKKDEKGGGNKGDPFWDQTSEALLKAMIYYILFNRPKEEQNLASCAALVRLGAENDGEDLMNLFKSLDPSNPARKAFDMIRLGSEKTFSNILVSLAAKLEAFDSEDIVALTSTNTIQFEDLGKEKSVVYFITPESHSTYDFIMNIFFSQLFQRIYAFADTQGGALPIPLFLILDEFANIGRIPNFEKILSTCRSKKLHISIILQSLDQLEEIYDEKVTQTIMANCSTQLFLGSNAQKTLETFSKLLGEKTISRDNVSKSTDKEDKTSGHSYSDQIMGRALLTPDELRRLDSDECIVFLQAMKPIRAKKFWYYPKVLSSFLWMKNTTKPHPRYSEAVAAEISHLSLEDQKRGEFAVTNPYELISRSSIDTDISFDDIWNTKPANNKNQYNENVGAYNNENINNNANINNNVNNNNDFNYDLQRELEKRFDELFGTGDN